ncbi:MAG TPA: DUF2147 domain-containing protein [Terracidiphilus sp.]|jgi:uncharacterized protein (DUF2147 family)|nr:DUF2147 domain-containing protein [Terracidiphilus sp.]
MRWNHNAACLCLLLVPVALAAQAGGVLGLWQDPTGSVIRIDRCGAAVCLWLVALSPAAPAVTDIHNPDAGERSRALCGLQIGDGFSLRDADHATGGTLYDPKTGKTYHGSLTAAGQKLDLRGYVGIPLFGASQTWIRHPDAVPSCGSGR